MNFKSLLTDRNRKEFAISNAKTDRLTHFGTKKFEYNSVRKAIIAITLWEPNLKTWQDMSIGGKITGSIMQNKDKKYHVAPHNSTDGNIKAYFSLRAEKIIGSRVKLSVEIEVDGIKGKPADIIDMPRQPKQEIAIVARRGKIGNLLLNEAMATNIKTAMRTDKQNRQFMQDVAEAVERLIVAHYA